jgi:hypothetical protein
MAGAAGMAVEAAGMAVEAAGMAAAVAGMAAEVSVLVPQSLADCWVSVSLALRLGLTTVATTAMATRRITPRQDTAPAVHTATTSPVMANVGRAVIDVSAWGDPPLRDRIAPEGDKQSGHGAKGDDRPARIPIQRRARYPRKAVLQGDASPSRTHVGRT